MNENIKQTSEPGDLPSSLAMQAGLALLDLAAALMPRQPAARRKLRTRLKHALDKTATDH